MRTLKIFSQMVTKALSVATTGLILFKMLTWFNLKLVTMFFIILQTFPIAERFLFRIDLKDISRYL